MKTKEAIKIVFDSKMGKKTDAKKLLEAQRVIAKDKKDQPDKFFSDFLDNAGDCIFGKQ
jgi:hypothetical protein